MSDDQVKRYQLDYHHTQTYAEMVEDCDGDWVKYNDYKAASDRIEELSNCVAVLEAKLSKSEALLAKAVEALAWCATVHDSSRARTTLAELKRQDNAIY